MNASRDEPLAVVQWSGLNSQDSLYGTALTLETSGTVHLVNRLMPSGTTIQEWYSYTDYQSVRDVPTLPLLRHGRTYRIEPDLETDPPGTVIFDVRFFDRFGHLLNDQVLHAPEYSFEYPRACHHYTVRLTNGGCDQLRFVSFALREVDAHD